MDVGEPEEAGGQVRSEQAVVDRDVDPRGVRFGAAVSAVVLGATLVALGSTLATGLAVVLLVVQLVAFGLGAFVGMTAQPYGAIFRAVVLPRVGPPAELEDSRPLRFAQLLGFLFVAAALLLVALGWSTAALFAVGLAFTGAFLVAAFDFCIGCDLYALRRGLRA